MKVLKSGSGRLLLFLLPLISTEFEPDFTEYVISDPK